MVDEAVDGDGDISVQAEEVLVHAVSGSPSPAGRNDGDRKAKQGSRQTAPRYPLKQPVLYRKDSHVIKEIEHGCPAATGRDRFHDRRQTA